MKKLLLIFIILSFLYLLLHIYVANFFIKSGFFKNYITKVLLFLSFISILVLFLRKSFQSDLYEPLYILSFIWMGYIIILSFYILFSNIICYVFSIKVQKCFFIIILLSISSLAFSLHKAAKSIEFKTINYYAKDLKRNYKLVFISDIHLDFKFKNRIFSNMMDKISLENPDLIIIGGDLLDPGFKLDEYIYRIKKMKIPIIFVYGNHEYYYGIDKSQQVSKELGFIHLNDSSFIYKEINIIGISDISTREMNLESVYNILKQNYKNNYINIFISHQPVYFKELSNDFDIIMLCGHTHCGQIFPFHIITKFFYKYFCGRYENKNSILYVSPGFGTWGPPLRFLSKSEILIINIKNEKERNFN